MDKKVLKARIEDITKTAGYKEVMEDIKHGRAYHAESVDEMFKQILAPEVNSTEYLI